MGVGCGAVGLGIPSDYSSKYYYFSMRSNELQHLIAKKFVRLLNKSRATVSLMYMQIVVKIGYFRCRMPASIQISKKLVDCLDWLLSENTSSFQRARANKDQTSYLTVEAKVYCAVHSYG